MNKREAKGVVKRTLGMMLSRTEDICIEKVYVAAIGNELPEELEEHKDLLDDCLWEVIDELSETGMHS